MAPAKAALDSSLCFLAKSFSSFSNIRFNSVNAGLLKTSASAGIPGYVDSYLHAEELTLRKEALKTKEVADCAVFLLGECSSGINAQGIVLDAGMSINYFDKDFKNQVGKLDKAKPVYVYCHSGGRSSKAMNIMKSQGFKAIYNLTGGYAAWKNSHE